MKKLFLLLFSVIVAAQSIQAQHSVAMQWNETQLNCIRNYSPKPVVHARNLFHASIVMYDMWAVYDEVASTYFLGKTVGGYSCQFNGISQPADIEAAQEMAISYAMYRYLWNRYTIFTPNPAKLVIIQNLINAQMTLLGYDVSITSVDYSDGSPAKLGNYIAAQMELYALGDGANQVNNYANTYYQPVNGDIWANLPGAGEVNDPNRWQELALDVQYDQNQNLIESAPPALGHEWGNVVPFALRDDQIDVITHEGNEYSVYLHQGPPPFIDPTVQTGLLDDFYKWGFLAVAKWHGFHGESPDVMIDLSPGGTGNNAITDASQLPTTFEEYQAFYDWENGGDNSPGYALNPVTGLPYEPQMVPRGDYTRVLSQFWADGPNSETPPGHWFTMVNYVANHPLFEKKWEGVGPVLPDLEWDVKAYFTMGGAIHDAAIACWSHKGAYDYIRPISAIRWMCEQGQSTDPMQPHYSPAGVPLILGFSELVTDTDPLVGDNMENLNKIKLWSWRGPFGTVTQGTQEDGPGWLLGESWWPYQTATFVTPPFSGYFSGHSTFSRSGAETMTLITGSEFFPGGLGEFVANPGYLMADTDGGPSQTIKLQWASYRDASDQCSISRIYGGLHPPQDDIPGRKVGLVVGPQAYEKAVDYFNADQPHAVITTTTNLVNDAAVPIVFFDVTVDFNEPMNPSFVPVKTLLNGTPTGVTFVVDSEEWLNDQTYVWHYVAQDANTEFLTSVIKVTLAKGVDGQFMVPALSTPIVFDTKNPTVTATVASAPVINDAVCAAGVFNVTIDFSENMNTTANPMLTFTADDPSATCAYNGGTWADANTFVANFTLTDLASTHMDIDVQITAAQDTRSNNMVSITVPNLFTVDTHNPTGMATISTDALNDADVMNDALTITVDFDEDMNTGAMPSVSFPAEDGAAAGLSLASTTWTDAHTLELAFDLMDANMEVLDIDLQLAGAMDLAGNSQVVWMQADALSIDTDNPMVTSTTASQNWLADIDVGNDVWITFVFDQAMDTDVIPTVTFPDEDPLANSLDWSNGVWSNNTTYVATYLVNDAGEEIENIDVEIEGATDAMGNGQQTSSAGEVFNIDTRNPEMISLFADTYNVNDANDTFSLIGVFDEDMDETEAANITFPGTDVSSTLDWASDNWLNATNYEAVYDVSDANEFLSDIDVNFGGLTDLAGNAQEDMLYDGFFSIETGVGISEASDIYNVSVYPNPVSLGNDINVYVGNSTNDLKIQLFNANGQLISEVLNADNRHFVKISTANLTAGMYLVNLTGSEGQASFNVSVVR